MAGLSNPFQRVDVSLGNDSVVGQCAVEVEKKCVLSAHTCTLSRQGKREMTIKKDAPWGVFICGRYWTRTSDLFRVKETR